MERYEKYKDSGVEWLGEIPEGWEVKKLKYVANSVLGKMLTNSDKGGYKKRKYLRAANVEWLSVNVSDVKEMWFSDVELKRLRIMDGDLLVSEGGEVGRTCIWKNDLDECYIQNSVHKVTLNQESNSVYFLYQFFIMGNTDVFVSLVNRISIAHLTSEKLKEITFIFPSKSEQTSIANYLDRKVAELDQLIAQKEHLLNLYEEEKTAIINQAVTKGINPDVKLKDSGIDWLGEIPEHWEVKKLKYVADIVLGKMLTNNDKGNYSKKKYLRAANIEWFNVNDKNIKEMWFSDDELKRLKVNENDLLVSEGGEVGRTCIWKNELSDCYIQNSVHKVTFNVSNHPIYFLNNFFILGYKGVFDSIVNRISIAHLTGEKLKEISFICPPLSEQNAIVQHIETEITRINKKITKTKKIIALQKEYRTALISEVVTGKIKIT